MPKLHVSYPLKTKKTNILRYACLGVASVSLFPVTKADDASADRHPNVLYVFPDQFRNSAMGFWRDSAYCEHVRWQGDPVHTPRLNAFADQSVVFSNALSNCPVSSAHRGMLLTGLYPNKSGVSLNCNATRPISDLRDDLTCLSDVFHQAGYECAYIGKLHAHFPTKNNPQRPGTYVNDDTPCWDAYTPAERRHGFTFWYSYGTFDVHKNPHYWDTDGNYHEPHEFSPKHEADKAIEYLAAHTQKGTNTPFFMMVAMNPPHSPYQSLDDCMEEDYNLYKDIPFDSLLVRKNINPALQDKKACAPYYFANVTGIDREFGRILDALDSLGLSDNTIVIFASDHGETMCSHVRDPKNTVYTESMNIPFLVRYPDIVAPAVNDGLFSAIDIMPTVVGMAGLADMLPDSLPGFDWSTVITKSTPNSVPLPKAVLYLQNVDGEKDAEGNVRTYFPRCRGVVTDRYTLSFTINRKYQLTETLFFDNHEDPYQMHNLPLSSHPEVVRQLLTEMQRLLEEADDPWTTILPVIKRELQ